MKKNILLVDDEPLICKQIKKALVKKKYEVDIAYDGTKAWEMFQNKLYPVVITDLRMPKSMDGTDLLANIKREYPPTQVIIITGHGKEGDVIKLVNFDAFYYIEKGDSGTKMMLDLLDATKRAFVKYEEESGDIDWMELLPEEMRNQPPPTLEEIYEITKDLPSLSGIINKMRGRDDE